jgi:hypothetical protein
MTRWDMETMLAAPAADRKTGFSALEWSVIALPKRDTIDSLAQPGRLSRPAGGLFGSGMRPRLADPRLEALRRLASMPRERLRSADGGDQPLPLPGFERGADGDAHPQHHRTQNAKDDCITMMSPIEADTPAAADRPCR